MIKNLFMLCIAALAAACSPGEPGPEYTTFPEISGELAQPIDVTEKDKVTITADVKNKYGAFSVYIYYRVNNGLFKTASVQNFNATDQTIHYKGWIPAQPAQSKVEWVVQCYNTYGLLQQTQVQSYDVRAALPDPEEQPE